MIDAVNSRDEGAFLDLFQEQDREAAQGIYTRTVSYLGDSGSYSDIKLDVDQENNYDAVSYVESGTVQAGGGYERSLSRSDGLMVVMENHKGVWYVDSHRDRPDTVISARVGSAFRRQDGR